MCSCQCGECCRRLIIEVSLADADREPQIAQYGEELYEGPQEEAELVGYLLNDKRAGLGCIFLDAATNRCKIWQTRPGVCRLYDCDSDTAKMQLGLD